MRRGTTPTHTFTTDIDLTDAEVIFITYEQDGAPVMEKTKEDLAITAESLTVKLTQEETLAFELGKPVEMQIRARFADGTAVASQVMRTNADVILKEGVI